MNSTIWEDGFKDELKFWRGWLGVKGKAYEKPIRLIDRFDFMIGNKKEVTIANLGAGPVCLIGDSRDDVKIRVFSSDILASEYSQLCQELNLKLTNPVESEDMASLTYKNDFFDIVYCTNALDHCQDPYKALLEMVRVSKPGGWIYLHHIAHEGQRHQYRNLHQWNIDMTEDGDCIFWNKNPGPKTDAFLLSEIYPGFKTTIKATSKLALVTSYVQKK